MNKCKECGRDEWGFLSALNKDGYCPTCAIKHNQDKIERLQEQLKEANEIISIYRCYDDTECGKATEYCKKWGVE